MCERDVIVMSERDQGVDCHDIAEILLKVVLNIPTLTPMF
jgi:hypothetical protein